jgi:hypothetical protein
MIEVVVNYVCVALIVMAVAAAMSMVGGRVMRWICKKLSRDVYLNLHFSYCHISDLHSFNARCPPASLSNFEAEAAHYHYHATLINT